MEEVKRDCEILLVHIKKCKDTMKWEEPTARGTIGNIARLHFKKVHKNHFEKIEIYTEKLMKYVVEKDINLNLETLEVANESLVIYNEDQVRTLGHTMYEHKMSYLENLEDNIIQLLEIVV